MSTQTNDEIFFVVKTSSQLFNGVTMSSHKDGTALGFCLKSRNWYCGSQGRPVDHKWHDLIWDFSRQNVAKASKLISIIFVWFLYFWEHLTYCDWALMDEIRPDENLSENHKN